MSIDYQGKAGYIPCKIGDVVRVITPERLITTGKVTNILFIQTIREGTAFFALELDDKDDLITVNDFDVVEVI